ncbi:TetR/AcrR family transcriptional regulator [Mycobacterium hubeiense]|uniref:TetR/AcrR family transcriptional regulator n=1 Tax=Mycobacterium hubeiense TaxID=1867256 RepID=UPI000C7EF9BC|nr:TetR/AcrR family transcriptional regulator [Mycobacterium sp. QGD 101]
MSVKRDYRSELRSAQARETRRAVVAAAARLFVQDGYGATTIDAVAQAAGVSRKTVFTAVGGKLQLLKTALDWAIAGDDQPVALADRPEMQRLLDDRDGVALLTGWARIQADIDARVAPLFQALEVAAGMDAAARELLEAAQRQRLEGAREVVDRLSSLGALAVGLTRDEAVDVAWLASDPMLFGRLVRVRGWSTDRFEEWLAQMLVGQLIGA